MRNDLVNTTLTVMEEVDNRLRVQELELQLKIFKLAERIGDNGNWQINLNSFETYCSDNLYRIYGLEPRSLSPHPDTFTPFIHWEDKQVVLEAFGHSFSEKIPIHLEFRIITADGQEKHVNIVSSVTKNPLGEPLLTGITQDITERKILELKLNDSREKLHLQNELSRQAELINSFGTWQINLTTKQSHFSDNFLRILGLKPGFIRFLIESVEQYIHLDDLESFKTALSKMFDEQLPLDAEFRISNAEGKQRRVRFKSRLIQNSAGDNIIMGLMQDITASRDLEKQIKEMNLKLVLRNEAYAQAEKTADIGSWIWELRENKISWSENFYQIFGLKTRSGEPSMDTFLQMVHIEDREKVKQLNNKSAEEKSQQDFTYRTVLPDGQVRHIRARNHAFESAEGNTIIIGTAQDITSEIRLQQHLHEQLHFAQRLSDTIVDRVMVIDTSLNLISWNKSCEEAYRLTKDEVIGNNFFDVFPQLKNTRLLTGIQEALKGNAVHEPATRSILSKEFNEVSIVPLKNATEKVIGALIVLHNITLPYMLKKELQERLQLIENLVESTVDRVAATDNNMLFLYWNSRCEEFYGLKKEDVVGKHLLEVFPQFMNDEIYPQFKKAMRGETVYISVNAAKKDDGESYLIPIKNDTQEVTGLLWVTHDLKNERKLQDELNKQRIILTQAEEIANIGSWELNIASNNLVWSDQMFRIYGYGPQTFEPALEFHLATTHIDDLEKTESAFKQASEGAPFSVVSRIYVLDGRLRTMEIKGRPVVDTSGKVVKVLGTMQDVTELKEKEEELIAKTNTLRLQNLVDRQVEKLRKSGSWQLNLDTRELIWAEAMYRLVGHEPYSFSPTIEGFVEMILPDDRSIFEKALNELEKLHITQAPVTEFRMEVNEEIKYLRTTCHKLITNNGRFAVGVTYDVTSDTLLKRELAERVSLVEAAQKELKTLNASLEEKNRKLKEMNEELTSFAFIASHDLREPLRKIKIFTDRISHNEQGLLSDACKDDFERLMQSVSRMEELIDDMLHFSSLNTEEEPGGAIDLNTVLGNVIREFSEIITQKNAIIEVPELPSFMGDPFHFHQVFSQLIENSLKFQPQENQPQIKITTRSVAGSEINSPLADVQFEYLEITFADNGIGFEEEFGKKIFQMFQRLHGKHEYTGTGMGLAICKKIAEMYNGFILVNSSPGKGSVFQCYFALPGKNSRGSAACD